MVFLPACSGGVGFLECLDFEVKDAVFERDTAFRGSRQVTKILVSDAENLCDRLAQGGTLAGFNELSIKSWETGSVQVALRTYGDDCAVTEMELASQGWVADDSNDPWQSDFEVVFQTEARSVSGHLAADFCPLPDDARIGCN